MGMVHRISHGHMNLAARTLTGQQESPAQTGSSVQSSSCIAITLEPGLTVCGTMLDAIRTRRTCVRPGIESLNHRTPDNGHSKQDPAQLDENIDMIRAVRCII